jgi:ABC-type glutathione transport system ATPase component
VNITQFWFGDSKPSFVRLGEMLTPLRELPQIRQIGQSDVLIQASNDCSFGYASDESEAPSTAQLKNVNFTLRRGALVAVVGAVAAGKSTLGLSLVVSVLSFSIVNYQSHSHATPKPGGCETLSGDLFVNSAVAFAPQSPWICNSSLRDNIIFHLPFKKALYEEVVRLCQLTPDLKLLPFGDQTPIGERGVNLSGGQKQRVSLARTVYAAFASENRDIIVLDDVLSALDTRVQRLVVERLILGKLRGQNKGVLLITHQLHVCSSCDEVIVLAQGRQVQRGTYEELLAIKDGPFEVMMRDYIESDEDAQQQKQQMALEESQKSPKSPSSPMVRTTLQRRMSAVFEESTSIIEHSVIDKQVESVHVGSVGGYVWKRYFAAVGVWWTIGCVCLTCSWVALRALCDYWLVFWVSNSLALSPIQYMWIW